MRSPRRDGWFEMSRVGSGWSAVRRGNSWWRSSCSLYLLLGVYFWSKARMSTCFIFVLSMPNIIIWFSTTLVYQNRAEAYMSKTNV